MFTLSDDKSAYGTLKGLVEALKKDIADAEAKRTRAGGSLRSHDAMRASGEIGAYNMTIALIMTTDIWVAGQREEARLAETKPHWHLLGPTRFYTASSEPLMRMLIAHHGLPDDTFRLADMGYSLRQCTDTGCEDDTPHDGVELHVSAQNGY